MLVNTNRNRRVYIASPLFSQAELRFNKAIKQLLEPFFTVYLPQEDGGLMSEMVKEGIPSHIASETVFRLDVQAIKDCDYLLMVLDGRAIDEGAAFELGLAFSLGKECIGLQTDIRRLLPSGNNPMIKQALSHTFDSLDELRTWAEGVSFRTTQQTMQLLP